jgi:hypothetical protein
MKMQVRDFLAAIATTVEDHAIAVLSYPLLARDALNDQIEVTNQGTVFGLDVFDINNAPDC